ncbi:MAG: GTP-binding protein, partial [Planctomycetota bacterium]
LLNKVDLVSPEDLDAMESRIRSMNAAAKIYRTQNSVVDMDKVIAIGGFDLDRALEEDPNFTQQPRIEHPHDKEIQSVGINTPGDLDYERFDDWMRELLSTQGEDIFRMKGVLSFLGSQERFVFQGVHMLFDGRMDRPWRDGERRNSLVFIGRNLDREDLNAGFSACLA